MDNGLIFPYPCVAVHTEAPVLTAQNLTDSAPSGVRGVRGCVGSSVVVGKRWGDAGR
jgi:hypothetical protein